MAERMTMMEVLGHLATWFDSLHSFFQNLLGAAVFAIFAWIARIFAGKAKKSGSEFFAAYQKMDMLKHFIHKELIKSEKHEFYARGYFLVFIESFRWVFRGILILVFFLGVAALVRGDWWMLLGYWFLLNCMLEASTWMKDMSSEGEVAYVDPKIKEEFYKVIYPEGIPVEKTPNPSLKIEVPEKS